MSKGHNKNKNKGEHCSKKGMVEMNKMILNTNQKDLIFTQQQRFILMSVLNFKMLH